MTAVLHGLVRLRQQQQKQFTKEKKKEPYLKYAGTCPKTYIMTNGVDKASQKQLNASFTFT